MPEQSSNNKGLNIDKSWSVERSKPIEGTEGDDTIKGYPGNNTISGLGGNDYIVGSRVASNLLIGGDGNDTLVGGSEKDDILNGGKGADHFVIKDSIVDHKTTITDFSTVEGDKIVITGVIIRPKDLEDIKKILQDNNITFGSDVDLSQLQAEFTPGNNITSSGKIVISTKSP